MTAYRTASIEWSLPSGIVYPAPLLVVLEFLQGELGKGERASVSRSMKSTLRLAQAKSIQ